MNWQSALTNWLSRTVRVASAAVTPSDKASARRVHEFWGQRARNWDSERGLHWTDLTEKSLAWKTVRDTTTLSTTISEVWCPLRGL